jgi:DNA-binding LacI/PurR family transcriptional regulator
VDNVKGGYLATSHLISKGHKKICYLAGPESNLITYERLNGYRKAMSERGLENYEYIESADGMGFRHGYEAAKKLLAGENRPTAIFAFNDTLALGAKKLFKEVNIKVPDDMALVGFDDIPITEYSSVSLTTVRQPRVKMCHIGVEMLLDILEGKYPKGYYAKVILQPELVIRESS